MYRLWNQDYKVNVSLLYNMISLHWTVINACNITLIIIEYVYLMKPTVWTLLTYAMCLDWIVADVYVWQVAFNKYPIN